MKRSAEGHKRNQMTALPGRPGDNVAEDKTVRVVVDRHVLGADQPAPQCNGSGLGLVVDALFAQDVRLHCAFRYLKLRCDRVIPHTARQRNAEGRQQKASRLVRRVDGISRNQST